MTKTQVSQLYVAIFNRASEGEGNTFWQNTGLSATEVANEMLATTDAQTYFGTSLDTNQAFVEHIYLNTLNKTYADDTAGVDYWVGLLDGGASRGEVVAGLVDAVAQYADSSDATTLAAYNQFTNRVEVSDYMADTVSSAPADYATSTSFSGDLTVTSSSSTVATAKTAVDALTIDGSTFTLTTSTDSFVGTANNDLFTAANGTVASADTILDSTSTDADIMNIESTSTVAAARIQNVETINVNGTYVTTGMDLANTAGTNNINFTTGITGGTATVTNASSINATNINASTNISTLSVTATASGTRDTVYVDAGSATTVTVDGGAGGDTFETTVGAGTTIIADGGGGVADTHTLNLTGATATITNDGTTEYLNINNTVATTVTVGATNELTADFVSGTNTYGVTLTGSEDITLVTSSADADVFDDKLVTDSTTGGTTTLKLTDDLGAAVANLNAVQVDVIELAHSTLVDTNEVEVNTGTTVNITGGGSVKLDADDKEGNGLTTNTLLLNLSNATTAVTTAAGVQTLLLSATPDADTDTDTDGNGFDETDITLSTLTLGANNSTVVISGSEDLKITSLVQGASSVISASGMTGDLTISGTAANAATYVLGSGTNTISNTGNAAATIHGGSGVDTITGGTSADTINGGAGNDIISTGGTAGDTIDAGSGDDTVTAAHADDAITLGSGSDTVIGTVELGYTIADISTSEDTVVITGAATTAVDLASVTPTTGAYKISNTGGTADFTLTGSTATDLTSFVQLGNETSTTITAYTAAAGLAVTAGVKDDVIAVNGASTISTGAGSDTVIVGAGEATGIVSDFVAGTDKVQLTGVLTADASIDLSNVTISTNEHQFATSHQVTLKTGSTTYLTATDVSSSVQLGNVTTALSVDAATADVTVEGGIYNDNVDFVHATAESLGTYNFTDNGGVDTITLVENVAATNILNFANLTEITDTTGTDIAANATKVADAQDGSVYVFADSTDGTGTEAISAFTVNEANGITADTILTDVAAFLEAALGEQDGETYVALINDGNTAGDAYAYLVNGDADGTIDADDISLIGIIDTTDNSVITTNVI